MKAGTMNGELMEWNVCPNCGVTHAFPKALNDVALARKGKVSIFCPNGHSWSYIEGESELDKMRRERDLLKQQAAQLSDEVMFERSIRQQVERQASARKGQITKMKNRAAAGVCPCCNRHFTQLERHMTTKHPAFKAEEVA